MCSAHQWLIKRLMSRKSRIEEAKYENKTALSFAVWKKTRKKETNFTLLEPLVRCQSKPFQPLSPRKKITHIPEFVRQAINWLLFFSPFGKLPFFSFLYMDSDWQTLHDSEWWNLPNIWDPVGPFCPHIYVEKVTSERWQQNRRKSCLLLWILTCCWNVFIHLVPVFCMFLVLLSFMLWGALSAPFVHYSGLAFAQSSGQLVLTNELNNWCEEST